MKVTARRPAEKNPPPAKTPTPGWRKRLFKPRNCLAALVVGALFSGGWWVWQTVRQGVLDSPRFLVHADSLDISAPPDWIKTDIRVELAKAAGLDDPVSILDPGLAERVYKACALHPWVARVVRVSKHSPARIEAVLEYRRPVCMVEVPGGLYPVDVQAVLLPSADFTPLEARDYPRLSGIQPTTQGPVGTQWPDARVLGAARIAAAILDDWRTLGLYRILPLSGDASSAGQVQQDQFELSTRGGTQIIWGSPPSDDPQGRALAVKKVAQLKAYHALHGSLDGSEGPRQLLLRSGELIEQPLRAARKP